MANAVDALRQYRGQSWPGALSDEPGLQQPAIDPIMILASIAGPSAVKNFMQILKSSPEMLSSESGALFPKGPMPKPFQYTEGATTPPWLQKEFGSTMPQIGKPQSWDIYNQTIQGTGNNINDQMISSLMNSYRSKNLGLTPEQAYVKALQNFFQAERFPGSDTRWSMLGRIDQGLRN